MRAGKRPSAGPKAGPETTRDVILLDLARHLRCTFHGLGRLSRSGLPNGRNAKEALRGVSPRLSAFLKSQRCEKPREMAHQG